MSKSKKLPYMPFYVGDLKKEVHYKVLPPLAKLLWLEILLVMWDSELRGMLILNGKPMTEKQIASATELDIRLVKQNLPIIKESQICSVTDDGVIFSRNMVKRCELSTKRSNIGKLGGNPNLLNQNDNQNNSEIKKEDKQTLDIDIEIKDLNKNSTKIKILDYLEFEELEIETWKVKLGAKGFERACEKLNGWIGQKRGSHEFQERREQGKNASFAFQNWVAKAVVNEPDSVKKNKKSATELLADMKFKEKLEGLQNG